MRASGWNQRGSEQLEQVVAGGHQHPFPIHLLQAPQSEAIQSSGPFDLAKHRFHKGLAQGVDRLAGFGAELAVHPAAGLEISGSSAS